MYIAVLYGKQYILSPWHKKPYYSTLLIAYRLKYSLGTYALEQNGLATHYQASEPVHLGTCVVQRWNTQEHIILCLSVMYILNLCRMHQALMVVQDSLWESCCSR